MTEEKALFQVRLEKRRSLEESGVRPYPTRFDRDRLASEIEERFGELEKEKTPVAVAGRLMTIRRMGKASFAHLRDRSGDVQLYLRKDILGEEAYDTWKKLEAGDLLGARGVVFRTKSGEVSVEVRSFEVLAKSLRPLPEKWHGLTNKETRYRQRYVDLIVNPEVQEAFRKRAAVVRSIRSFLDGRGFLEVETPILQPLYGGASARPFVTHHNALNLKLYLRIADELYLKRLIIGGLEKVYEIGKDFRNEGIDRTHNPEFTQLELYEAYSDFRDMMRLLDEMLRAVALETCGGTRITFEGRSADLADPWREISFVDALSERLGRDILLVERGELRGACTECGFEPPEDASRGAMMDALFAAWIEPGIETPTFVVDFPKEISPLAKERADRPGVVERFEPYLFGMEIGNAFSELNDPLEQRARFEAQRLLRGAEREEAQQVDEDFLRALEYGMPPTGGMGVGIDRLSMIFGDQPSIRDVLFFPQLRPEGGE
ncbi:MAG: lysine--tRNA ligase [Candidatus Eisenbacteria bacterium]